MAAESYPPDQKHVEDIKRILGRANPLETEGLRYCSVCKKLVDMNAYNIAAYQHDNMKCSEKFFKLLIEGVNEILAKKKEQGYDNQTVTLGRLDFISKGLYYDWDMVPTMTVEQYKDCEKEFGTALNMLMATKGYQCLVTYGSFFCPTYTFQLPLVYPRPFKCLRCDKSYIINNEGEDEGHFWARCKFCVAEEKKENDNTCTVCKADAAMKELFK